MLFLVSNLRVTSCTNTNTEENRALCPVCVFTQTHTHTQVMDLKLIVFHRLTRVVRLRVHCCQLQSHTQQHAIEA